MGWLKKAIALAEVLAKSGIKQDFEHSITLEGLELLKERSEDLEALGKIAFKRGLIHGATGNGLSVAKSWHARQVARRLAQSAALDEKAESDAAWEAFESIAVHLLRAALPFVLAAL